MFQDYQTKLKTVQALIWDGTEETYNLLVNTIKPKIKSFTINNGSTPGELRLYVNNDRLTSTKINIGDYIVITDIDSYTIETLTTSQFESKYMLIDDAIKKIQESIDSEDAVTVYKSLASLLSQLAGFSKYFNYSP